MSSDLAISCVKKPSESRSTTEIDILIPWLRIKSALFADLDKEIVADILKNCEYEDRGADEVIIKQGEKGESFYVILSGKVSVYINTEAVPGDDVVKPSVTKQVVGLGKKALSDKIATLDRSKYGKFIAPIDAGKSFGELALINDDCVRNASIISDEKTHLLVVNRDLFNRCLKAAAETKLKEKKDFVEQCSVFEGWPVRYKRQVYMSLVMENYSYGSEMVRQGESVNGLIFLLSGQATYVMDTISHQNQFPQFKLHLDQAELRKLNLVNEISDRGSVDLIEKATKFTAIDHRRLGYKEAEKRMAKRRVEALIIRPGEIIGDLEQGFGLTSYAQTVICTQQCSVYIFGAKNFERLVSTKRNPKTLHFLRQRAEMRILSLATRVILDEAQVPLFTALVNLILDEYNKEKEDEPMKNKRNSGENDGSKMDLKKFESFIPPRGPVIDLYGPGTVFFRTRMLRRKARLAATVEDPLDKEEIKSSSVETPSSQAYFGWEETSQANDQMMSLPSRESLSIPIRRRSTMPRYSVFGSLENSLRARRKVSRAFDWESGSDHLQSLEERLRNWYCQFSRAECDAAKDCVIQMKRFIKQEDTKVYPGKKIRMIPKNKADILTASGDNQNDQNSSDSDEFDDPFVTRLLNKRRANGFNLSMKTEQNESYLPPIGPKVSMNPLTKTKIIENTTTPQYSLEEYKELKKLMQQRERQLQHFLNDLYT